MFRLLLADPLLPEGLTLLQEADDVQVDDLRLSRAELLACLPHYDALIVRSATAVDRDIIEQGTHLKVIGRAGMLSDNIDVPAATERGILVLHTPQAYTIAAVEHTLGLMLALCRHLPAAEASVRQGEWNRRGFVGTQLYGKTLGLLGFGRVGQGLAPRAQALGMEVLACDPYLDPDQARALQTTVVTLDELLARADILSLHAALTPETEQLLGRREFALMKRGARLINAARGELVDETALAEALTSGQLAGAALDVYAQEPPTASPLLRLPNVVCLPHIGSTTVEAQREVSIQIARQVLEALRGQNYENAVNLAFMTGPDFPDTRPYLELAQKIGALHGQLAEGPIRSVEVEVRGAGMGPRVKAIAVALLAGLLSQSHPGAVNYINAPMLAAARNIRVSQARGLPGVADYGNLISCRVTGAEGRERLISGTLFGGQESRIVQLDAFRMEAKPEGVMLIMFSRDVPGVIGRVGTFMEQRRVNIAEWRLGRDAPGGTALSFINLDNPVSPADLEALRSLPEVITARTVTL